MKKKLLIIILLLCFFVTGCKNNNSKEELSIVSTSFPGYDFARAVTEGSNYNVSMLLNPGSDLHSYEPTPQDIIKIQNSKLFIYVGGDSDNWVNEVLESIDTSKTKVIKLMDLVSVKEEELVDGMEEDYEEEHEYDEHVWTSPINAIKIVNSIKDELVSIDSSNKDIYERNAEAYTNKIKDIDKRIKDIVSSSKRNVLVFGDRFPLRYFVDEYNLEYYAAFPGCSEQTEASAKTISFLIEKVKILNIPVVLRLELSSGNIANTISIETGAKVLEFNSAHNISKEDFDKGITYIDIMNNNINVLKEALN